MALTTTRPDDADGSDDAEQAPLEPADTEPTRTGGPLSGVPGEWAWTSAAMLCGVLIGLQRLVDNSFLTHLATGRWILENGGVPRTDLYTYTSAGEGWTAQSWFASILFALLESIGSGFGIRLFFTVISAALAAIVWNLTKEAKTLVPRVFLAGPVFVLASVMWTHRPLMIGLLGFVIVMLAVERPSFDLRWLVPVLWVWVNSHGSYPLAGVYLIALIAGTYLDGRKPLRELETLKWVVIGILVGGVLNPYGPKMLFFPIRMLGRMEMLRHIKEWQSPSFDQTYARAFLALLLLAIVGLVRKGSWRTGLPIIIFSAAALMSLRNMTVAAFVLVFLAAPGLADLGSIRLKAQSKLATVFTVVAVLLIAASVAIGAMLPSFSTGRYPESAVDHLEETGIFAEGINVFHADVIGNYLGYRYGDDAAVFIDDRFELHSEELVNDFLKIRTANEGWETALDRWGVDVVLFGDGGPLFQVIERDDAWDVVWQTAEPEDDADEVGEIETFIACRTGTTACELLS